MSEMLLPIVEEEWKRPAVGEAGRSLLTPLGIIEGEILTALEEHGPTTLRRLIRELKWPTPMVMMAIGALIRERLVRATQQELNLVIEPMLAG